LGAFVAVKVGAFAPVGAAKYYFANFAAEATYGVFHVLAPRDV